MTHLLDNNILKRLTQTNVLVGIILLILGVILAFMAGFITKKVRHTEKANTSDRLYLILKAVALVLIMTSLIAMIVE